MSNRMNSILPTSLEDSAPIVWALVPVKSLSFGKQRLNGVLGSNRPDLSIAMFKDVLKALFDSKQIDKIAVVTADPEITTIAKHRDVLVIDEPIPKGMNAAIKKGLETIRSLCGDQVAIIPADLPLLTGAELDRILTKLEQTRRCHGNRTIGIGSSKHDGGTNFLCLDVSRTFRLNYGYHSYQRHLENAKQCDCFSVSITSEEIALDIDTNVDLQTFVARSIASPRYQTTSTWQYLQDIGYVESVNMDKPELCVNE